MSKETNTMTEQLYKNIEYDIISGKLKPGLKLTTKFLQETYNVSSSPIREALSMLQANGLVTYTRNVGMRVIELSKKDIHELFTILMEFDCIALRLATSSDELEFLKVALKQNLDSMLDCIDDISKSMSLSDDFHLILYQFADNSRLKDAVRRNQKQYRILSTQYEIEYENRREIWEQHNEIYQAIASDNIDEAERLLRLHQKSSYTKAIEAYMLK